ncbi:MAG TPA: heparinase II/III family protein [Polyangia bacterium]
MTRLRERLPLLLSALVLVILVQQLTHGPRRAQAAPLAPVRLEARAPIATHPRILLDAPALARLRAARKGDTPAWKRQAAACDAELRAPIESGYQGLDWGDAVAGLSLCWHATGDRRFADGAVRYLNALLDDRYKVGDKQGGDDVVRHDDGYGMRAFGVYAALGYDWLYHAPAMTPALRARIRERLGAWIDWYRKDGYLHDQPISNYFVGYLTAETFAGLAAFGDAPQAADWLSHARSLIGELLIPAYATTLRGGGWPEGWQYGELTCAEVALVVTGLRTATGVDLTPKIPWLREVVTHHLHALQPGSRTVYDNGDWGDHPARASALALTVLPLAIEPTWPTAAAEARWMTRHELPPFGDERAWMALLAERTGGAERDPHLGAPLSITLPGTGLSFMRSAFRPDAVWTSLQAGPTVADHQHNDQGHFELWRGADGLVVDGGDDGSASTMIHNSLLVDDGGKHLDYSPNQGVWGKKTRTTRFYDDRKAVVAVGDLTDAYSPSCVEDGCSGRSVRSVVRTLVFVRPKAVVIDDRLALEDKKYGVTWTAHFTVAPEQKGAHASAVVGGSRVDVTTLWPAGAQATVHKEPTVKADTPYRIDDPWGPMWRLDVESPRGTEARRFLHVLQASDKRATPTPPRAIAGQGISGVELAEPRTDVLFADAETGGAVTLPSTAGHFADDLLLVGLAPGARYQVTMSRSGDGCAVRIARGNAGSAASPGGALRVGIGSCYNQPR